MVPNNDTKMIARTVILDYQRFCDLDLGAESGGDPMQLLVRHFIKNWNDVNDPKVRTAYGVLSGTVGIFLNLLLFAVKLTAGLLSASIAVIADAFNNLSDAGSSILTLIGFHKAGEKPDAEHPFGHGRMEYLTGLIVSVIICVVGVELAKESISKIIHPEHTVITAVTIASLLLSIGVKFYMYLYNMSFSRHLGSVALESTAKDSISDVISTSVVLACSLIARYTGILLDGWGGAAVAVFIVWSGFSQILEAINPLLGEEPDPALVKKISDAVMSYGKVLGIHDLIIHDYGPGRRMLSVHIEVPSDMTLVDAHQLADTIELRMNGEFGIEAVVHVDPIDVGDPETKKLREKLSEFLDYLTPDILYHDFRVVHEREHVKILFDIAVPYGMRMTDGEIVQFLKSEFHKVGEQYRVIVQVDHYKKDA